MQEAGDGGKVRGLSGCRELDKERGREEALKIPKKVLMNGIMEVRGSGAKRA